MQFTFILWVRPNAYRSSKRIEKRAVCHPERVFLCPDATRQRRGARYSGGRLARLTLSVLVIGIGKDGYSPDSESGERLPFPTRRQEFFTALVNGGRGARIFEITSMREFFAAVLGVWRQAERALRAGARGECWINSKPQNQ